MNSSRIILITSFIFASISCFGQTIPVLELKDKKYFSERNHFLQDTSFRIRHVVNYNEPYSIDEEYSIVLILSIADTTKVKLKKSLDLVSDTAIVKCHFNVSSVWIWENKNTVVTGSVSIVSWLDKKIVLEFDVVIRESTGKEFTYKGKRAFKKAAA